MSRRAKKSRQPGRFARLPSTILQSDIVRTLSHRTFRVWVALADQCQEWNNGTGKLCRSVIAAYGLGDRKAVGESRDELLRRGLIVQTRRARQRICALYGVTHLPPNLEAMAKAGARWPDEIPLGGGPAKPLNDFLVAGHPPHMRRGVQIAKGVPSPLAAARPYHKPPIPPGLAAGRPLPSKTLPSGLPDSGAPGIVAGDAACAALLAQVRAAGGSITTNGNALRVRWWQGDPDPELAARIQIQQRALFAFLQAGGGA